MGTLEFSLGRTGPIPKPSRGNMCDEVNPSLIYKYKMRAISSPSLFAIISINNSPIDYFSMEANRAYLARICSASAGL